MYVEYDSNNSGGDWWLDDEDWYALEKAGWKVQWEWLVNDYTNGEYTIGEDGLPILRTWHKGDGEIFKRAEGERWLGALATHAYRKSESLREAVDEWEEVTGKCSTDAGCPCCGPPHNFTLYDENGKYVDSGPDTDYSCSWD